MIRRAGSVTLVRPLPSRHAPRPSRIAHGRNPKAAWRPSLTTWIFVGLAVGILVGAMGRPLKEWSGIDIQERYGINIPAIVRPLSLLFLNLIKSIIAPLVFSTLVIGIAHTGDIKQVGRMGLKSLVYFEVVTTIALFVGLAAVNVARPGVGVSLSSDSKAGPKKDKAELVHERPPPGRFAEG